MSIPIIDFTAFRSGEPDDRRRVARELGDAAESLGFAVIGGHGLPRTLGEDLREVALRFFNLPLEEKLKVRRPKNDQNRGYIPFGEETLVRMAGGNSPPDVKEVFAIGPDDIPDTPYFRGPGSYPSFAPNLWPETPVDDERFARDLYHQYNLTVLPGSYLSRTAHGINPGAGHVRLALVPPLDECLDAAERIREYITRL